MSGERSTAGATAARTTLADRVEALRHGPRAELVTGVAFLLGLGLGTVHWLGLVAGGALVGLVAPSLRRALVLGAYLGGAVAVAFVAWLWLFGALGAAAASGPLFGLSLVLAVGCPILGAGIRGLG